MNRFLVALVFSLFFVTSVHAQQEVGKVVIAKGQVELIRDSDQSRVKPKTGERIYLNDRVVTGKSGFAKLLLKDKSILKVSPSSELKVSIQLLDTKNGNTTIDLLKGKLRSVVVNKLQAKSKYEIKTSVAVAGVRGTDFEVVAGAKTQVRCFEGLVGVRNVNDHIKGTVLLRPNTLTTVQHDSVPKTPVEFKPEAKPEKQKKDKEQEQEGQGEEEFSEAEVEEVEEVSEETALEEVASTLEEIQDVDTQSHEVLDEPLYGDPTDGRVDLQVDQTGREVNISVDIPNP